MKNHFSSLTIICIMAVFASCKKKTDIEYMLPNKPTSANGVGSRDDLAALLKSVANKPETFTVNATIGGKFTSSKGITYTIDPGIFVKPNGETAQGDVQVTVQEVTQASEMILNDMPTNAIILPKDSIISPKDTTIFNPKDSTFTRDTIQQVIKGNEEGGMLNSFGEIKVDASQGGENLELKPNTAIEVEIPQPAIPEPIISGSFVPLWDTVKELTTQLIGRNHENMEVSSLKESEKRIETGCQWVQDNGNATTSTTVVNNNNNSGSTSTVPALKFNLDQLGSWKNCDVLIQFTRTTTVLGYFTNVYNNSDTTSNYQGVESNMLFFKKKGDNTIVKLYNPIVAAPTGKKGFLSYQNTFGIGMEGTFLALVNKDGKYFAQQKTVIIGEPENGKNYVGVNFILEEVTQEQMFALIDSMNDK
jgi:hypothetical protein